MIQQINLLNPALLKQKLLVNAMHLALTVVVLLGLILAYSAYAYQQLHLLSTQRNQAKIELSAMQAKLNQIATLHRASASNQELHNKILQLERQEILQQKVLHLVNQSAATDHISYAAIMRAFARQSLEGLWLTGFSIENHSTQLSIRGRSLLPEIVPEYITRLGDEAALQGKSFAALSLHFVTEHAIANNSLTDPALVPTAAKNLDALKQLQQKNYIEFVLKSKDEPSPANINQSKTGGQP